MSTETLQVAFPDFNSAMNAILALGHPLEEIA